MNVRTFLLGALCGAVVFSILDRLMEERERRLAVREVDSPAAEVRSEARTPELQPAVTAAPAPGTAEQPATSARAMASEEPEIEESAIEEPPVGERGSSAQLPHAAEASEVQGDAKDSGSGANESSDEETSAAVVRADDEAWGPFMEQALRQFLASHRSAAQFDIQAIRCASNVCEIRAVGFDESTEPVWQQVVYDIRQQPWAEFGRAGTTGSVTEGRFVATARLLRRPRT